MYLTLYSKCGREAICLSTAIVVLWRTKKHPNGGWFPGAFSFGLFLWIRAFAKFFGFGIVGGTSGFGLAHLGGQKV